MADWKAFAARIAAFVIVIAMIAAVLLPVKNSGGEAPLTASVVRGESMQKTTQDVSIKAYAATLDKTPAVVDFIAVDAEISGIVIPEAALYLSADETSAAVQVIPAVQLHKEEAEAKAQAEESAAAAQRAAEEAERKAAEQKAAEEEAERKAAKQKAAEEEAERKAAEQKAAEEEAERKAAEQKAAEEEAERKAAESRKEESSGTEKSKTEESSKAEEPKKEESSKTEEPKAEESKIEESKAEESKAEESKKEESSKAEEPKKEESSKTEESIAEEPKAEEPAVEEPAEESVAEEPAEEPAEEEAAEEVVEEVVEEESSAPYSGGSFYTSWGGVYDYVDPPTFRNFGAFKWNGSWWTYYSEKVLPGEALDIPGRWSDTYFVKDGNGFICLASDDYSRGTVIDTPWGAGKVYDSGSGYGNIDVYVTW